MSSEETQADAEMRGMSLIPQTGTESWAARLQPPHPPHISVAAGALVGVAESLQHGYKAAYRLDDAGLLADGAQARTEYALAACNGAYLLAKIHGNKQAQELILRIRAALSGTGEDNHA